MIRIIGAGISGLSLARMLQGDVQVYEKDDHVGGHCSSVTVDGWTFDQGPHILFSKHVKVLEWMHKHGPTLQLHRRQNRIWRDGRLLHWPEADGSQYSRKLWKYPLEDLELPAITRITDTKYTEQEYFWYPKTGGYQAICEALAKGLDIQYGIEWVPRHHRMEDKLIWTGPYNRIAKMYSQPELPVNWVTVVTCLGYGPGPTATAIYYPEDKYVFNRVTFPCNFSGHNERANFHLVQYEATWNESNPIGHYWRLPSFLHAAVYLGYPVPIKGYKEAVEKTRKLAAEDGIILHGRFAEHEYWNADRCVLASMELAERLNG